MAQLQWPSQKSNDAVILGREQTDVSVKESPSPMTGSVTADDAMSLETLGDQEVPPQANDSSMSLPFQADVGPVSAVYTKREVYVTPGGEVTEQVTEYTTTTMQAGTGNELALDAAAGTVGYEQMNPSAGFGNQAFYETSGGLGGHGSQFMHMPGFALSNTAINTDPTATAPYSDATTGGSGRSHPAHAQNAPPVDTQSTETTPIE